MYGAVIEFFALGFVCGAFVGGVIGVFTMCLMFVAGDGDGGRVCGKKQGRQE